MHIRSYFPTGDTSKKKRPTPQVRKKTAFFFQVATTRCPYYLKDIVKKLSKYHIPKIVDIDNTVRVKGAVRHTTESV